MKNSLAFVTLCAVVFVAGRMAATPLQTAHPAGETYLWHGELVALDAGARIMTVKSTVVGSAVEELGHFKMGDRVTLTWSGLDKYANAINHAVQYDATRRIDDRFTFSVEFVAFDAAQKYLTFKTPVPAETISKLQLLKVGEWVTVTSPHGEPSKTQPVVGIRQYNEPVSNS